MTKLYIRELGLASYVAQELGVRHNDVESEHGEFVFESDKTKQEWMAEYVQSKRYGHDEGVMILRRKLK